MLKLLSVLLLIICICEGCQKSGKVSPCTITGPSVFHVGVGSTESFTLLASCKHARVMSKAWQTLSPKLHLESSWIYMNDALNANYRITAEKDTPVETEGIVITEWCDANGGYFSHNTTIIVKTPIMPPVLQSPAVMGCRAAGELSSCLASGPKKINITAGEEQIFKVKILCPAQANETFWTASQPHMDIKTEWSEDLTLATHSVLTREDMIGEIGYLETRWCDYEGKYFTWKTEFTVVDEAKQFAENEGVQCANSGKISQCSVVGPPAVIITPNGIFELKIALSCPASSVYSRWHVSNYGVQIEPVFGSDLSALYILETGDNTGGIIGNITTEFCDSEGGYLSATTTFYVDDGSYDRAIASTSIVYRFLHNFWGPLEFAQVITLSSIGTGFFLFFFSWF